MIKSMTGYGRGEYSNDTMSAVVEMRSVNHRYCDVTVRMPHKYSYAEKDIKAAVKENLLRGKIEVSVTLDVFGDTESDIRLNRATAQGYISALRDLEDVMGITDQITLGMVAGMPDVIKAVPREDNKDAVTAAIMNALDKALDSMVEMRAAEGRRLAEDLLMRADKVESIKNKIAERAPEVVKDYSDRLRDRVNELLSGVTEVPEDRIAMEAAVFADKADITEELVRLGSHVKQLREFINSDEPALGKKIDFLIQEMNRESNTIGSKSNDNEITSRVIDLKAEVEKIREQVQNIE